MTRQKKLAIDEKPSYIIPITVDKRLRMNSRRFAPGLAVGVFPDSETPRNDGYYLFY